MHASREGFGLAWLFLCSAFGLHVWDEAAHDFLSYYNATVLTLYGHFSWFPRMDMTFREWLTALIAAVAICMALTPFAFRNARWLRPLAYLFALIQFLNGVGHVMAQILGRTVPSVHFEGISPGFYTSPLLLAAPIYLFRRLRRTRNPALLHRPRGKAEITY
jgi:hypothetical protein